MPVKYIDVAAISDLFVPATRAFGDIAIVGKGAAGTAASAAREFTNPADASAAYPPANPGDPPTDLAAAIAIAFRQSPPPTKVWGVQVPGNAAAADWDAGLAAVALLDVQIVCLANTPLNQANAALVGKLATHVDTVSNTGADGMERIGVAMLDSTLTAAQQAALNTGTVADERMFLVAHISNEDAAAAAAGVIAGYEPQISMLLKPIRINMTTTFSDSDIDTLNAAFINWITSPVLFPGHGLYMGEGYTANPSQGNKKYIDIVRTIDDINFRVKAELIQSIGNFRVSRSGLRSIVTLVQSVLSPLVAQAVIEDYLVYIPLLVLLDKDPTTLSAAELAQIQQHQADRTVDMVITVVYAGAIHRLQIKLVFK
jgi:hypothetical protein